MAHEAAHELLHRGQRRGQTTKKVRETEAEAVGFVVAQAIGLDSLRHAADYIGLYSGDAEMLAESMAAIQKTAAELIEALYDAKPCEHTLPAYGQVGRPPGTRSESPGEAGIRISCGQCGKLYHHLPLDGAAANSAAAAQLAETISWGAGCRPKTDAAVNRGGPGLAFFAAQCVLEITLFGHARRQPMARWSHPTATRGRANWRSAPTSTVMSRRVIMLEQFCAKGRCRANRHGQTVCPSLDLLAGSFLSGCGFQRVGDRGLRRATETN